MTSNNILAIKSNSAVVRRDVAVLANERRKRSIPRPRVVLFINNGDSVKVITVSRNRYWSL